MTLPTPEFMRIAFFVALCVLLFFAALYVKRMASLLNNRAAALAWFADMRVDVEGQSYRGAESTIVWELDSCRHATAGYELIAACKTNAGARYFVRIVTSMCTVVDWELVAATAADFDEQDLAEPA